MGAGGAIDRAFVRIREGLVHFRHASGAGVPLYMIHPSPASSVSLVPLMEALAGTRRLVAPDTLGNGDSAPPEPAVPDMTYYADTVARILDALGVDKADVYGSHTGAHIACELALSRPDRVGRLILDGLPVFPPELAAELLAHYAPEVTPDDHGRHLIWTWNVIRDQSIHFPYFLRDPAHRLDIPMAPTEHVHRLAVEVLKSIGTYHKGYRAAFRHDVRARVPLLEHPVLCLAAATDPLHVYLDETAALIPGARKALIPRGAGAAGKADAIRRFLTA